MSLTKVSSAREAPITERISTQWPSNMMSISVASSQKNTSPSTPRTTAMLYAQATVIAKAISVIIPG